MTGQIQEKILEVRLANFHSIQSGCVGSKFTQTFIDVVGFDLDNALCFQNTVLVFAQVA